MTGVPRLVVKTAMIAAEYGYLIFLRCPPPSLRNKLDIDGDELSLWFRFPLQTVASFDR
jgi:hypothetical protein